MASLGIFPNGGGGDDAGREDRDVGFAVAGICAAAVL